MSPFHLDVIRAVMIVCAGIAIAACAALIPTASAQPAKNVCERCITATCGERRPPRQPFVGWVNVCLLKNANAAACVGGCTACDGAGAVEADICVYRLFSTIPCPPITGTITCGFEYTSTCALNAGGTACICNPVGMVIVKSCSVQTCTPPSPI